MKLSTSPLEGLPEEVRRDAPFGVTGWKKVESGYTIFIVFETQYGQRVEKAYDRLKFNGWLDSDKKKAMSEDKMELSLLPDHMRSYIPADATKWQMKKDLTRKMVLVGFFDKNDRPIELYEFFDWAWDSGGKGKKIQTKEKRPRHKNFMYKLGVTDASKILNDEFPVLEAEKLPATFMEWYKDLVHRVNALATSESSAVTT